MVSKQYDYIIVGSGFFGSICAFELTKIGKKCLVLEKRNHIGGNCYTENRDGINIHKYGPHIFHTSNDMVWNWINQFVQFNNYRHNVLGNYKDQLYSLPFNMFTFNKLWGTNTPEQAKSIIDSQRYNGEITNLEEQALALVGKDVYEYLIKGYTIKQWKKHPTKLPKEIIKRLPVRFTYDNNYFNDKYQGIPIGGYTQIFEKLLTNIEVKLNVDYLEDKDYWNSLGDNTIFTGPIDSYYNYIFGNLEYKTTNFILHKLDIDNFQGVSQMNYTEEKIPYTRIIEHKHFENTQTDYTWISKEYPVDYKPNQTEPYYPVNDKENNEIYNKYKSLSSNEQNVFFGGRLAEYKYYDMHQVIESALNFVENIKDK
jgi:UDP-galactopyranose mutase